MGSSWRIDETYIKVKGHWVSLYRGVDKAVQTINFFLSKHRDMAAAKQFLQQAIEKRGRPEKLTLDGYAASQEAVGELQQEGLLPAELTVSTSKYLNNLIEQDHRRVKQRVRSMLGFQRFDYAAVTLTGIELVTRSTKSNLTSRLCVPLLHELHKYGRPYWLREQHVKEVLLSLHSANCTTTPCLVARSRQWGRAR